MRYLILILLSLFTLVASAEQLKIERYDYHKTKTEVLKVPFVTSGDSKIAQKINDVVFKEVFDLPAPKTRKTKLVLPKENGFDYVSGTESYDYKVLLNNGNLLSYKTEFEGCGAYCENGEGYFNFDANTGKLLKVEDIFKKEALPKLQKQVYQARDATIQKTIKALKKQAIADQKKGKEYNEEDGDHDPEDKIALYESCDISGLDSFFIDAKGITFVHGRCSNHAMRALDDIDKFYTTYSLNALKPYFSDYAKGLFLNNK